MTDKELTYITGPEQDQVARAVLNWLNEYPDFPARVTRIEQEYLSTSTSMGLFAITAPYKTQEYISGSYEAQYQFALQYRVAATTSNQRLAAAEVLSNIAAWAESRKDLPDLGLGKQAVDIERTSPAVMLGRGDGRNEDYQILMIFSYKVCA